MQAPWTYERVWEALTGLRRMRPAKVVLFGTSTTIQQLGYSAVLSYILDRHWSAACEVRGYGGQGISLAGLVRLDGVIEAGPQLVLVDFTTGPIRADFQASVDRITTRLAKAGILPVWVAYPTFLPDGSFDEPRSATVAAVGRYCDAVGAPFIDIFHAYRTRDEQLFRDRVHPTKDGAIEIGRRVWAELDRLGADDGDRAFDPARLAGAALTRRAVDPHADLAFSSVEALGLDEGLERDEDGFLVIPEDAVLEITVAGVVHSADMRIGPYSPILDIRSEDGTAGEVTLWDEWCHFEREMLIPMTRMASFNPGVGMSFRISFSERRPDYARVRRPFDFSEIRPMVKLKGFHHQGEFLQARLIRGG